MTHRIATRDEWRAERLALLEQEKELTRRGDEIAAARRALPWVPVERSYVFDTPRGPASLLDLFAGRSQLLVYHFMLSAEMAAGCASCSSVADGVNGPHVHLEGHDVAFVAVSRAPLAQIEAYRARLGWSFRWVSCAGSDFNFDYAVSSTEERPLAEYNFAPVTEPRVGEYPGISAFARDGDRVFHTYSSYGRGVDATWGVYAWLDRAPLGRNEDSYWHKRRDEYPEAVGA